MTSFAIPKCRIKKTPGQQQSSGVFSGMFGLREHYYGPRWKVELIDGGKTFYVAEFTPVLWKKALALAHDVAKSHQAARVREVQEQLRKVKK